MVIILQQIYIEKVPPFGRKAYRDGKQEWLWHISRSMLNDARDVISAWNTVHAT